MPHIPVSIRVLSVVALLVGCAAPPPKGTPTTLKTYPHATDRLTRLLARQLTDSDPLGVQQLVICEEARLADALGTDEAMLRARRVHDSVYASPAGKAAWQRIRSALSGHSVEFMGPLCDSLNVIADREDPIVKVDTAKPPGDTTR